MEGCIKYETAKEIFGCGFEENAIVAYDTGVKKGKDHPIRAYCWDEDEQLWWFGCSTYDCTYSEEELRDRAIVTVA